MWAVRPEPTAQRKGFVGRPVAPPMRILALALVALFVALAVPSASAGTIPDPNEFCTPLSVCYCVLGYTFDPFPDALAMASGYIVCGNLAIDCTSEQFLAECLVG
jgi:hypothetical protein